MYIHVTQVHGEWRRYAAFLVFQLLDSNGTVVSETHRLLCEPKHAVGLSDPEIRATVAKTGPSTFELKFRSKRAALFVYLDYPEEADHTLSDNGFLLWGGGTKTVIMEVAGHGSGNSEEKVRRGLSVMSYYPQKDHANTP